MLLMYVKSRGGGMQVGCGSCMYVSMQFANRKFHTTYNFDNKKIEF